MPAASVLAWTKYARWVVEDLRDAAEDFHLLVPADTLDSFERYLDEWEAVARASDPFRWSAEVDPDTVEYLVHAWFILATRLAARAEQRGVALMPAEGEAFYQAVVGALLDALAGEGRAQSQFSAHLRDFWPGLEDEDGEAGAGGRPGRGV